jgi:hypothetical protein
MEQTVYELTDAEVYEQFVGSMSPSAEVADTVDREYTAARLRAMFQDWTGDEDEASYIRNAIRSHVNRMLGN